MEPRDPPERRPETTDIAAGAADDRPDAGKSIGPLKPSTAQADPAATISYHPSRSGIGLALGTAGAVAIHDLGEFVRELTENGLAASTDVEPLRQQIVARMGPCDAAVLARELVRLGHLTAYQAAAVLQGKTKGLLIGSYLVLDKLGAGSMGIVFKARHRLLNRIVALKLLPPSLARDPAAVQRFHREAKAAATLSHPNVVAVLDADEFRGLHFLVMEYALGRDLARLVREDGPMAVPQAIDCIVQAARGLQAAFDAAVVHRDIKPSNLLLEPDGTVKILDMGLARVDAVAGAPGASGLDASLTQSNMILGTIDYMSPEQASNPRNADHRSDIYSLGCTLHYLLSGRPPYSGETLIERLIAHREQPIPIVSGTRPGVAPAVDTLLARMLAKSPAERFSTFGELIAALELCRQSATTDAGPPPLPTAKTTAGQTTARRRSPVAALFSGIAVVLTVIGAAVYLLGRKTERPTPEPAPAAVSPTLVKNEALSAARSSAPKPRVPSPRVEPPKPKPKLSRPAVPAPAVRSGAPSSAEPVGLVRELKGHQGRVYGVAASSDGRLALSGGQDRTVRLWNLARGTELRRFEHDGPVYSVALAADGRQGVSGSADTTVRLWDFRSEQDVGMRRLDGHTAGVLAVLFSGSDQLVVSAGADRTVRVWNAATGLPSGLPLLHDSAVVALASTGTAGILAGCEDGTICLWDLESRQRVRKLKAPGPVLCLAAPPPGHRALSGHADGVLVVWDLDLGSEIGRMIGHSDLIRCAAALPDAHRAIAGSQFGNLILWNIDSRRELHRFGPAASASEHAGQLALAALADDLHVLSAGTNGTLRLWRLPADVPSGISRKSTAP